MTLAETLLQKLNKWTPPAGRQELTVSHAESGWSVHLAADRKDEVGCSLWELSLQRPDAAPGDLNSWALAIVKRVTGLLEPLKIIEIDPTRNEALLRSASAQSRDDKLFYYEVLLHGTSSARLRRYAGTSEDAKREQVAFALTQESIVKALCDLTST